MEYTGERVVKGRNKNTIYYVFLEHFYRYCFARRYCLNKVVLDSGCGTGYGAYELSKSARKVIGIDIAKEAIDFCRNNYTKANIEFLEMDIRSIKFDSQSFDCVVSFETLEHIYEQEQFLQEVKRVLKPGGILIISTPDKENYRKRFVGDDQNRFHKKELSRDEFNRLLERYFTIRQVYGQVVMPQINRNLSGAEGSNDKSLFKDFLRRSVEKNNILCRLFVVLSLKKRRYAVRLLNKRKKYIYLIAVCINSL